LELKGWSWEKIPDPSLFYFMAKKKTKTEKKETVDERLSLAKERFKSLLVAESENRATAIEMLNFVYNVGEGHWPEKVRKERETDGRPCLTSNKLRKYVSQVANRERDQRMTGKVKPVDDMADPATAKIIEGIIRQIEYTSNANDIYANAGEKAVAGGFGYWRIVTVEAEDSFEQDILLKPIDNQFNVYIDPKRRYAFVREVMSKKEFEAQYPNKLPDDFDLQGQGGEYEGWYEPDKVYLADYYYQEKYDRKIAQVADLMTGQVKTVELKEGMTPEALMESGYQIIKQKTVKATKIKWAKMSGHEFLEEGEWIGKDIPIIEVLGDSFNVAGKTYKNSLVYDAKDPQRIYNFWLTHMTETVSLAPKSPYIVTPQEIKGYEPMWNDANKKNFSYLLVNQQGNSKPRREPPPQVPTGAAAMLQIAAGDIQDTIGMYQASFGERSNERTGVAIRERAGRSEFGTYHFGDNFRRAILASTKQLIDIIPKIYDTERIVRILGEDGQDSLIPINQTIINPVTAQKEIINDITVGKYDVVADVGMYSTRRQEAVEMMATSMQAAPNIAPLIVDLLFKASDWPYADEIEKRLKQYMPQLLGSKEPIAAEQPTSTAGSARPA